MTVSELIEKLKLLPNDAEIRVTVALDLENSVNLPARDIRYEEIGPLRYVEIIDK